MMTELFYEPVPLFMVATDTLITGDIVNGRKEHKMTVNVDTTPELPMLSIRVVCYSTTLPMIYVHLHPVYFDLMRFCIYRTLMTLRRSMRSCTSCNLVSERCPGEVDCLGGNMYC